MAGQPDLEKFCSGYYFNIPSIYYTHHKLRYKLQIIMIKIIRIYIVLASAAHRHHPHDRPTNCRRADAVCKQVEELVDGVDEIVQLLEG